MQRLRILFSKTAIEETFLEDVPRQLSDLERNLTAGDVAAAERQIHSIKGAAVNLGSDALAELASQMEQEAKAGGLSAVLARFPELRQQFQAVRNLIRKLKTDEQEGNHEDVSG